MGIHSIDIEAEFIERDESTITVKNFSSCNQPVIIPISRVLNWIDLYDQDLQLNQAIIIGLSDRYAYSKELL